VIEPPRPKAEYRYWACDLRTGAKIAQLPLKPTGPLQDRIGDIATTSFSCDQSAVWRDGGDFIGTTTPGRTVIVVEREYEGDSTSDILWAGIVLPRKAGSDADAQLTCATIPVYLNRRYPTNHSYSEDSGHTDTQILTDLLGDAATEGIGFVLDIDCPTLRTWRYTEPERRPIFACLKDLADQEDGPEWTVTTRWADANRLAIRHTFIARTRLGWAGTPNVRFDYPGTVRKYDVDDDFTEGHGGNHIRALTGAGAASTPARDEQAITQQGWPRWEENISTSGDLNAAGLAGAARTGLKNRARGQATVDLELDMTYGPQYGRDWVTGDNALFFVAGPETTGAEPPSFRHPNGHSETIRVIGVDIDIPRETITPMLWSPYEEATA
jgi:hypothetical protein